MSARVFRNSYGWTLLGWKILLTMQFISASHNGVLPSGSFGVLGSMATDAMHSTRLLQALTEALEMQEPSSQQHLLDPTKSPMVRHFLNSSSASTAVCNDNSSAGFYLRRSRESKEWIVFLEGGWYCFDDATCRRRHHTSPNLMTSRGWPERRIESGIISPDPDDNPYWWRANHVFVPYCSSDSWTGTKYRGKTDLAYSFMGSVILTEVVKTLLQLGFTDGHHLVLAGSSAGAVGVMMNLDRVARQLVTLGLLDTHVRGVADSGWFLDSKPYVEVRCQDAHRCHPSEVARRGMTYWQGLLPDACLAQYPSQPWNCYFGYRIYPTLKAPLYVFQWIFDEAQMVVDNVGRPMSSDQWNHIHKTGQGLQNTLKNITSLFAPSCIAHTVLQRRDWASFKINDVTLAKSLDCWDNIYFRPVPITRQNQTKLDTIPGGTLTTSEMMSRQNITMTIHKKRQRRKKNHRRKLNQSRMTTENPDRDQSNKRESRRKMSRKPLDNETVLKSPFVTMTQNVTKIEGVEMLADEPSLNFSPKRKNKKAKQFGMDSIAKMEDESPTNKTRMRHAKSRKRKQLNGNIGNKTNHNKRINSEGKDTFSKGHEIRYTRNPRHPQPSLNQAPHGHEIRTQISHQANADVSKRSSVKPHSCKLHHTDECTWPQCNTACPKMVDPHTGQVMTFIDLLRSFGVNLSSVAEALGIDLHTLASMSQEELIQILTQR